jgi:hypothetical protein
LTLSVSLTFCPPFRLPFFVPFVLWIGA